MNRGRAMALLTGLAIAFGLVVGLAGIHSWFGFARFLITLSLAFWVVMADTAGRDWISGIGDTARGWLRIGVAALLAVDIGRVVQGAVRYGFVVGDAIEIVVVLALFAIVLQGALANLNRTPGGLMLAAALRARPENPRKALRIATRATRLYRRWDRAWLVRADIVREQQGTPEEVLVLREALRHCRDSEDVWDMLIPSLNATGAFDEAADLLQEYHTHFRRSARPVLLEAANAIVAGDFDAARVQLTEARDRAQVERDLEGLMKLARMTTFMPLEADHALGVEALQWALRAEPDPEPQVLLGLLIEEENPTRARSLFDQARAAWDPKERLVPFDQYVEEQRTYMEGTPPTRS